MDPTCNPILRTSPTHLPFLIIIIAKYKYKINQVNVCKGGKIAKKQPVEIVKKP